MADDSFKEFVPDQLNAGVNKTIFIFAALLASLVATRADLVMEQQSSNTNVTDHIILKVHDDKLRMDQSDSDGYAFSVIIDLKTRDSLTLFPRGKTFLKRSGAEIRRQMEMDRKASGGTNDIDKTPVAPVNTGKTEKVDGYDTEIYKWSGARGLTETMWVATNFPDYDAIRADLAKIDRFDASGPHRNAQPESSRLPGMVVKTRSEMKGQTAIVTLISAREEPVDASLFDLPADYSPWKPPTLSLTNSVMTPNK